MEPRLSHLSMEAHDERLLGAHGGGATTTFAPNEWLLGPDFFAFLSFFEHSLIEFAAEGCLAPSQPDLGTLLTAHDSEAPHLLEADLTHGITSSDSESESEQDSSDEALIGIDGYISW